LLWKIKENTTIFNERGPTKMERKMKKAKAQSQTIMALILCIGMMFWFVAAHAKDKEVFHDIVNSDFVAQYAKLPPPPNSMIIDVRTSGDYNEGHIFGSFNIPADQPGELLRLLPKNKNVLLVFYDQGSTSLMSHQSAWEAEKLGYNHVKVFAGGVIEWKKAYSLVALTKEVIAEGFTIVNYDYVKQKVGTGIRQLNQVVIIDARPEGLYSAGHIPSAISLPSMKFNSAYPDFEKLNIAKDTEIILGIGRECELSLKNAQRLRNKGYTNLKLYIAPPVWIDSDYQEIDVRKAKELITAGVPFIDSRPANLFDKGTIEGAINIFPTKFEEKKGILPKDRTKPVVIFCQGYSCVLSHEIAKKLMDLGYQNVLVYAGGYPEWEKIYAPSSDKIKSGKGEGTIDVVFFEEMLKSNPSGLLLIDVRSSAEFSTGSFKASENIPISELEKKLKTLDYSKPIVFVCATGARSGEAYFMVKDVRSDMKNVFYLDAEVSFNKDGSYKIIKVN
jgi:rhodanese-related sulfurtransferase